MRPHRFNSLPAPLEAAIVFLASLAVLVFFADRNGYEGDDLNAILPMLTLPQALQMPENIYKFDWQPLAYWTGYAAYSLTGTIVAIFALSQIAVAGAIAMLWVIVTRCVGVTGWLFVPILLMFPEILYTGLYYNSSALGFPFAVLAMLLAFAGPGWGWAALSGLALGIAVTMRIDYALTVPAIALFQLFLTGSPRDLVITAAAGLVWLGLSFGVGLLDLGRMLEVYASSRAESVDRAGQGGWDIQTKLLIATTIFSPVGWAVLLIGSGYVALTATRRLWGMAGLMLLALLPFLYTLQNLLSVKYLMPVFALLPVLAALLWRDMTNRLGARLSRISAGFWGALSLGLLFAAPDIDRAPPYLYLTVRDARVINTHDGPRSWGSYLLALYKVERMPPAKGAATRETMADAFVTLARIPGDRTVWMIGDPGFFSPGGLGWNLIYVRLERLDHRGRPQADGTVHFDLPMGRLVLASRDGTPPDGTCIVQLESVKDPAEFVRVHCADQGQDPGKI